MNFLARLGVASFTFIVHRKKVSLRLYGSLYFQSFCFSERGSVGEADGEWKGYSLAFGTHLAPLLGLSFSTRVLMVNFESKTASCAFGSLEISKFPSAELGSLSV